MRNNNILNIIGIVGTALAFLILLIIVEKLWIDYGPLETKPGYDFKTLGNRFVTFGAINIAITMVITVIWYLRVALTNRNREGYQKSFVPLWWSLLIISLLGLVICIILMVSILQYGWQIIVACYLFNTVVYYYFTTLVFAPVARRYCVPGSKKIRLFFSKGQ